jgi:Tol biopolymer transport system component
LADKKTETEIASVPPAPTPAERVESWKEIAAYLSRDVRTVQRWEKSEALPVYRHMHDERGTVYAYKAELDAWWNNRRPRLEKEAPETEASAPGRTGLLTRRRLWAGAAVAAVIALVSIGFGLARSTLLSSRAKTAVPPAMILRQVWTPAETLGTASVSRDGQYLAYTGAGPGPLWLRDLAGNQNRRLTHPSPYPEYAAQSALSPDGTSVAYRWFNQDFTFELRVLKLATNEPRVLYRDTKAFVAGPLEWSPDGRHIATVLFAGEKEWQLSLISLADGSVQPLKTFRGPAAKRISFSPDGRYLAYDRSPDAEAQNRDIFLLRVDRQAETHVVDHPANDSSLGWTPDGQGLLFASDRAGSMGAWFVPVSGGGVAGAPRLVKPDLGAIEPLGFSQNGSYYYSLQRAMSNGYVAELEVNAGTVLSPPAPVSRRHEGSHRALDWSPDGRYLAYLFERSGTEDGQPKWGLSTLSLETGEERELPLRIHLAKELRWAPDGRSLISACAVDLARKQAGICRIAAESGEVRLITRSTANNVFYRPMWTPDGKAVLYLRIDWDKKMYRFFRHDLETGQDVELYRTVAPGGAANPALAPDGRRLAFFSPDQETREPLLRIMDTEQRKPRTLFRMAKSDSPYDVAWTPDGRYLLFVKRVQNSATAKTELWRVPVEGGAPERIALEAELPRDLRPHPDGRRIAFLDGTTATEIWVMENFLPATSSAR